MKECVGNPEIPVFYLNKVSIHIHNSLHKVSIHVHGYLDDGRAIELSRHLANLHFICRFICIKLPWAFCISIVIFIFLLWWMCVLTTYYSICQQCTNHHNLLSLTQLIFPMSFHIRAMLTLKLLRKLLTVTSKQINQLSNNQHPTIYLSRF